MKPTEIEDAANNMPMRLNAVERQFLPAALEVLETPPSPIGRGLLWLLLGIVFAVVAWVSLGELDVVAIAHGQIVPNGQVKEIQPLHAGVVTAIHVREGQIVEKGQLLIELDPTGATADQNSAVSALRQARRDRDINRAFEQWLTCFPDECVDVQLEGDARTALDSDGQARYARLSMEYRSRFNAMQQALNSKQAGHETTLTVVAKLEAVLPIVEQRAAALRSLFDLNLGSRAAFLEVEQDRLEKSGDLKTSQASLQTSAADIREIKAQLNSLRAEQLRITTEAATDAERKIETMEQDLIKTNLAVGQTQLRSPVAGSVQELTVNTIGGVVTPAERLLTVVPTNKAFEVEAFVENKDIGFVNASDEAQIKLDAFPFTRYGTLPATLGTISLDAIEDEQRGLVYLARAQLQQQFIDVDGKQVPLQPGMRATVEVQIGKRRILEYVLSPLIKYRSEAARER